MSLVNVEIVNVKMNGVEECLEAANRMDAGEDRADDCVTEEIMEKVMKRMMATKCQN